MRQALAAGHTAQGQRRSCAFFGGDAFTAAVAVLWVGVRALDGALYGDGGVSAVDGVKRGGDFLAALRTRDRRHGDGAA